MLTWTPAFGIGHWEMSLIRVALFIRLGRRLPRVMRHLGRRTVAFRDSWMSDERFRAHPKTQPMSLAEWLIILMLVLLLVALLLPQWTWT
jgi:Sec-independent protein translocase protein TatA